MTGPEHYAESARLLDSAQNPTAPANSATRTWAVQLAQVHATLALVAATTEAAGL